MRILLLTAFTLLVPSAAWAQDKFLGLLELPALCASPCPGSDKPVPLYTAPWLDEPALALSRALFVQGDPPVQDQQNPLWPVTEEFARDQYGAVVSQRVDATAYRIRTGEQDYWVKAADAGRFHPYPQILKDKLAYLQSWDARLWSRPAEGARKIHHPYFSDPALAAEIPIRLLALRQVDGRWWMQVEIFDRSPCGDTRPPFFEEGWVPAHTDDGSRAAWFDPEGC